jgi:hypothetical protein
VPPDRGVFTKPDRSARAAAEAAAVALDLIRESVLLRFLNSPDRAAGPKNEGVMASDNLRMHQARPRALDRRLRAIAMPRATFVRIVVIAQHLGKHHALDIVIIDDDADRPRNAAAIRIFEFQT